MIYDWRFLIYDCGMLEIATLGGFTLRKNGNPIVLSRRLEEAMLVYLLFQPQPVPRATLIDLLWYDIDPKLAGNNFRATLSRLRKSLGDYLIVTRLAVGFDFSQPHSHDAAQLERDHLGRKKSEQDARVPSLESTLEMYAGDFLAGFELRHAPQFEAWVLLQQERLRLLARDGFARVADNHFANGNYATALHFATRLTEIDPLNEEAHRLKMTLHLRNRERNAALQQFAVCQTRLADELAVEPTKTTVALFERLQSADPHRNNLHPARGTFFGRSHPLQTLTATLGYRPQLITLQGQGGVGKSRLAQEVGRQMISRLRDGVFFVSLVAVENRAAIVQAIADAIGLSLGRSADPQQTLFDHLQSKELLLILDNFEHLRDSADFVANLLTAAPELRVIVTSRERLWLRAEQIVRLDGLDDDPAVAMLANRAGVPTDPELRKVVELVEGLPLALEMVAGQLTTQNIATLASRFHDTPTRHATMQAVFDYSWALLGEEERRTLAALGVFSADFTTSAAQAICQAIPQTLTILADKSLLIPHAENRWRLHPLIREFAQARSAQLAALRRRHAFYYLNATAELALQQQEKLLGMISAEKVEIQSAWQWATNHNEHGLLTVAHRQLFEYYTHRSRYVEGITLFTQTVDQLTDIPLRGKLQLATGRLHIYLSQYDAAETALNSSLQLCDALEDRAAAMAYLGAVDYYRGGFDSAETHLTNSLNLRRESGFALNLLANIRRRQGRHAEARDLFAETIAARCAAGDQIGEAMALNNLGIVEQAIGDYAAAKQNYEASGRLLAQLNNPQGVAATLLNAASAALRMGDLGDARRLGEESVTLKRDLDNPRSLALSLCTLGEVAVMQYSLDEAEHLLSEGLALAQAADAQPVVLDLQMVCALLAWRREERDEAVRLAWLVMESAETDELQQRAARLLKEMGVNG